MKILLLSTVLWSAFAGGDRERGMQLYKDGNFVAAQAAFVAALAHEPESAELQWNLALASWRAGDLETAEVAAEKYAALSRDAKDELHRGMLGAIRFAEAEGLEAKADAALEAAQQPAALGPPQPGDEPEQPLPLLEKALQKAVQAKDHFVRGVRAKPTPELVRNTERTLRKIDELMKRIEELRKQQEEQEKQDGDQSEDDKKPDDKGDEKDKNKSDDQKGDEQNKDDQQKKDDDKGDEKKPSEGEQSDDQKKDDQKKDKGETSDESDPKEGEGENPPESPEPQPKEADPEPKPSSEEGKDGESDPTKGQKPEDPEPGKEQDQTPAGEPPKPPEPKPGEPRSDAPGEGGEGLELTREQAQRLLARAKKLDEQLKKAKARRTTRRRAVERDW
ncbi:MAG: tetratricopeptide (TPR) repeat protein [Hyphomicrobiaceae bacterium]|jgi:tetratricopeptide (TPR) repeat protein